MFLINYALRSGSVVCTSLIRRSSQIRSHHGLCTAIVPQIFLHKGFLSRSLSPYCVRLLTQTPPSTKPLTLTQKLKLAIRDYGSTVIVFHVTISLISLSCFYLAVYSGLDIIDLLKKCGFEVSDKMSTVVEGAGTFAIAYAVHKIFAPVRISITLGTTPFIVRHLRRIGFLKAPKSK